MSNETNTENYYGKTPQSAFEEHFNNPGYEFGEAPKFRKGQKCQAQIDQVWQPATIVEYCGRNSFNNHKYTVSVAGIYYPRAEEFIREKAN